MWSTVNMKPIAAADKKQHQIAHDRQAVVMRTGEGKGRLATRNQEELEGDWVVVRVSGNVLAGSRLQTSHQILRSRPQYSNPATGS